MPQITDEETTGIAKLDRYKLLLDDGTRQEAKTSTASRYDSLKFAFEHFEEYGGKTIVELGTIRSYLISGKKGCLRSNPKYWAPNDCENWDWGAGCFSLLAAECLSQLTPTIHTVDIMKSHIERCKVMTAPYRHLFHYHVSDCVAFLNSLPSHSVDLMYLDAGEVNERGARLQLLEAESIVGRDLLTPDGSILIDDVTNKYMDGSDLGKGRYAIPYLAKFGYKILFQGYQCVLGREST